MMRTLITAVSRL